jgi:hypothetical protein
MSIKNLATSISVTTRVIGAPPFELVYDPTAGIVRTMVRGFWSLDDADAYFRRLGILIHTARREFGHARVLVDRRGCPVQSAEVAQRMSRANRDLFPTDRLAIVVDSNLVRMQMRRLFSHQGSQAFLSYEAAMTWLLAR